MRPARRPRELRVRPGDGTTATFAAAAHDALAPRRRWARAWQILSAIERLRIDLCLDRASAGPRAAADPAGRNRRGGTA